MQACDRVWPTSFPKCTSVGLVVPDVPGHFPLQIDTGRSWVPCESCQVGDWANWTQVVNDSPA